MLRPKTLPDLTDLLRAGHFDPARSAAFGAAYDHRFARFAHDAPFMQRPATQQAHHKRTRTWTYP
jgi:hypothetical protein